MNEKRIYTFGNGQAEGRADMRNLLGGKGELDWRARSSWLYNNHRHL